MRSGQTWLGGSTYPCSMIPVSTCQNPTRRDSGPMPIGVIPRIQRRSRSPYKGQRLGSAARLACVPARDPCETSQVRLDHSFSLFKPTPQPGYFCSPLSMLTALAPIARPLLGGLNWLIRQEQHWTLPTLAWAETYPRLRLD